MAVALAVASMALSWSVLAEGPESVEAVIDPLAKTDPTRLDRPFFSIMGDSHGRYEQTGSVLTKIPPSHLEYVGTSSEGPVMIEVLLLGEPVIVTEPAGSFAVHRLTHVERLAVLQVGPIIHESPIYPRAQILVDSWSDVDTLAQFDRVYAILPPVPLVQGNAPL